MANTGVKIVAAIAVIAAAGTGGVWYVLSGKTVKQAEALITRANETAMPGGATNKITYASIARTPFPIIGARLTNPTIEYHAAAREDMPQSEAVDQQIKMTGALDFITDYLGHRYKLINNASGQMEIAIGEKKQTATWDKAKLEATLTAKDLNAFRQWQTLNLDDDAATKTAARDIAGFSLIMGPWLVKDAAGNMAYKHDAMNIDIANHSTDTTTVMDVRMNLKASEASAEYAEVITAGMTAAPSPMPFSGDNMPFAMSRAGKQDFDIDLSINMPDDRANGMIHVRKLAVKNNFYTLDLPTEIAMQAANGARKTTAKLDWKMEATAAGASEMQRLLDMLPGMLPMGMGQAMISPETTAALKEKVTAALPTLSTLGPITFKVDLEMDTPTAGTTTASAGQLTIRDFNFSHKRWGVLAKGNASGSSGDEKVEMTITCQQCDTMTSDLVTTASQAEAVVQVVEPGGAPWGINDSTLATINALLAELGAKDAEGNLVIAVTTPAKGDIRINNKPMAEVMMKAMAVAAPQMEPAAGAPSSPAPAPAH